ncbi:MAG: class I SAM-dependent methyltransferase, partial [Actinomycetales bacterium]|nr:class I SAM-dependent methyltransferase [Actinomycetales bacterium]
GHVHGSAGETREEGRFAGERAVRYERRARSRDRFYRGIARDALALAPEGGHVLDVGTGPGQLVLELARARADVRVMGVDLEPSMVELAQRAVRTELGGRDVRVHVGDVAELPLEASSVDVVVASMTAHHWPDMPAAVRELVRVVRPGGALLVVDFRSAVEGQLTESVESAAPGARVTRKVRWAWGLPALATWEIRVPPTPTP